MNADLIMAVRDGRPDLTPTQAHILLLLATYSKSGVDAFPSVETLVQASRSSTRTVQRALAGLCEAGAIRALNATDGSQGVVRYAFILEGGARAAKPPDKVADPPRQIDAPPRQFVQTPRQFDAHKDSKDKEKESETRVRAAPAPDPVEIDGFAEFYAAYPLHKGRRAAARAYAAARKRASHAEIMAGLARYAADRAGKADRFTAHPSSWLNADRWADEIPTKDTRHDQPNRPASGKSRVHGVFVSPDAWRGGCVDAFADELGLDRRATAARGLP